VLKACIEARAELAGLKQATSLIPNAAVLINTIPTLEAQASTANLVDAGIAQRQSASVYLKALVELGVLQEQKVGRDKLFLHPRFLRLLSSDEHGVRRYG
jgi:hypothetical protein